jgi:5-methylcytosine-specific restriction endonuclease McrBC regulatory subunit McrC
MLGVSSRDNSWNAFARAFVAANNAELQGVEVQPAFTPDADQIRLHLRPGGTIGAVPLRSPTTRKVVGGLVVRPRFGWNDIGPLLSEIGWTASPRLLNLQLVPGAAKEVPPWVLAGPVLERIRELLNDMKRGFRWQDELRQSPRGQILWNEYISQQMRKGSFHELPCRFPELGPDPILRGMLRWAIEIVQRSLADWVNADSVARRLSDAALLLLSSIADAKPVIPARSQLEQMLSLAAASSQVLSKGLQALSWLVDERGLAGTAATDGLAWSLPMHELFERWVEHIVRLWAHSFGGQVRTGRSNETLTPIRWERGGVRSLNSLVPDLIVRHARRAWIIDAKYKGHFEDLDEHRWVELVEDVQAEHRRDMHQALAYAAVCDADELTTVLAYPMKLATWERLRNRNRDVAVANIAVGARQIRLSLIGIPIQVHQLALLTDLIDSWQVLNFPDVRSESPFRVRLEI